MVSKYKVIVFLSCSSSSLEFYLRRRGEALQAAAITPTRPK